MADWSVESMINPMCADLARLFEHLATIMARRHSSRATSPRLLLAAGNSDNIVNAKWHCDNEQPETKRGRAARPGDQWSIVRGPMVCRRG